LGSKSYILNVASVVTPTAPTW